MKNQSSAQCLGAIVVLIFQFFIAASCDKKNPNDSALIALMMQVQEFSDGAANVLPFDQHWVNAQSEFQPIMDVLLLEAKNQKNGSSALMSYEEITLLQDRGLKVLEHLTHYILAARDFFTDNSASVNRLQKAYLSVDLIRILFLRSFISLAEVVKQQKSTVSNAKIIDLEIQLISRIEALMSVLEDRLRHISEFANEPYQKPVRDKLWSEYMRQLKAYDLDKVVEKVSTDKRAAWAQQKASDERQAEESRQKIIIREKMITDIERFLKVTFSIEEKTKWRVSTELELNAEYQRAVEIFLDPSLKQILLNYLKSEEVVGDLDALTVQDLIKLAHTTYEKKPSSTSYTARQLASYNKLKSTLNKLKNYGDDLQQEIYYRGKNEPYIEINGQWYLVFSLRYLPDYSLNSIREALMGRLGRATDRMLEVNPILRMQRDLNITNGPDLKSLTLSELKKLKQQLEELDIERRRKLGLPQSISDQIKVARKYTDSSEQIDERRCNSELKRFFDEYHIAMTAEDVVQLWWGLYDNSSSPSYSKASIIQATASVYLSFRLNYTGKSLADFSVNEMIKLTNSMMNMRSGEDLAALNNEMWSKYLLHFLKQIGFNDLIKSLKYLRYNDTHSWRIEGVGAVVIPDWVQQQGTRLSADDLVELVKLKAHGYHVLDGDKAHEAIHSYFYRWRGEEDFDEDDFETLRDSISDSRKRSEFNNSWRDFRANRK